MISRLALMFVLGLALFEHATPEHAQERNAPRFKAVAVDYFGAKPDQTSTNLEGLLQFVLPGAAPEAAPRNQN